MSMESKLVNLMMSDEKARQFIENNFDEDHVMPLQRLLMYLEQKYLKEKKEEKEKGLKY